MKDSLPHDAYTELADSYAKKVDNKPHNAYYDRPGIQSLLYNLQDKTILDAGCGTGIYTEWLLNNGSSVIGIDANEKMLSHAIKRNGNKAKFIQANLEEPLTFLDDKTFDGIISPLTLTYCKNLVDIFSEFSRILKDKGWLVFSTEHPFFSYRYNNISNYYRTKEVKCIWTGFEKHVEIKSYYHSLGTITEALSKNNFVIEKIIEPLPIEKFKEVDLENYNKLINFPMFIFVRAFKYNSKEEKT